MGYKASLIVIQNPNKFESENVLLNALGFSDFHFDSVTTLDECMWPSDKSVNIGYYNGCIIICEDCQVMEYMITTNEYVVQDRLNEIFPSSEILSVVCMGTTNYHGYSLRKGGKLLRAKEVSSENLLSRLDEGPWIEEEAEIYAASELLQGIRVWQVEGLPSERFSEDQMMEDFTFGIAKRLLGVRLDHEEADALLYETDFRKFIGASNTNVS